MKVQMEVTDKITIIDGVKVRLWEGVTEGGTKCKVFVHRIAVRNNDDCTQFEKELKEQMPSGRIIDLRQIL